MKESTTRCPYIEDFPGQMCFETCLTGFFRSPTQVSNLVVDYMGDQTDDYLYDSVVVDRFFVGTQTLCYTRVVERAFIEKQLHIGAQMTFMLMDVTGEKVAWASASFPYPDTESMTSRTTTSQITADI